jgi:molybdopterin/thiamine biosynthesis adenylyltransferase
MNFARNAGFVSSKEQEVLGEALVAVAGVGGDGGLVAELLARMGVRRFRLADPEDFEAENLNRQNGCTTRTLGRNKAEVIAEVILAINPDAEVDLYTEGINAANVDTFVEGTSVVVDETEFTLHALAVMLARACRQRSITIVTGFNVGFGCLVTSFQPAAMTLEEHLGLPVEASLDEIAAMSVDLGRWVPRLPSYMHEAVFDAVARGELPAPSVAPGVALASGVVATEVFNVLTGRQAPVTAPAFIWMDALQREMELPSDPAASFERSLAEVRRRTRDGLNPPMADL